MVCSWCHARELLQVRQNKHLEIHQSIIWGVVQESVERWVGVSGAVRGKSSIRVGVTIHPPGIRKEQTQAVTGSLWELAWFSSASGDQDVRPTSYGLQDLCQHTPSSILTHLFCKLDFMKVYSCNVNCLEHRSIRHTSECRNTLSCEEVSLLYVCIREGWDGSNSGLFEWLPVC